MRTHFLVVASVSSTLVVAALGWADPQASGGGSVGLSVGTSPSASASASLRATAPPSASTGLAAAPQGDAQARTGAAPSDGNIAKGHAAYLARDFQVAISAYKEAVAKDTADPAAYYFLGEAELAAGSAADADASFAAGLRNAGTKDEIHGKLLFVVADLRERQGKWPEAKKAWEEYAQFLGTHPNVKGYSATATERVKMVDGHVDLEAKYAPVKLRIEQRLKENAAPPPPPPDERPPPPPARKK